MPSNPEDITLDRVLAGESLARFGDGELMIMNGQDARKQPYHEDLAIELRKVLEYPSCMIGVPRVCGPRASYWKEFLADWDLEGASSFISRPDEAPWIDRPDYWDKVRSLWQGRDVVLIRGGGSLTKDHLGGASGVIEVFAPENDGWEYEEYISAIASGLTKVDIVLLCLGATATVLADRFAQKGIWAVDLGSIGKYLGNTSPSA